MFHACILLSIRLPKQKNIMDIFIIKACACMVNSNFDGIHFRILDEKCYACDQHKMQIIRNIYTFYRYMRETVVMIIVIV